MYYMYIYMYMCAYILRYRYLLCIQECKCWCIACKYSKGQRVNSMLDDVWVIEKVYNLVLICREEFLMILCALSTNSVNNQN